MSQVPQLNSSEVGETAFSLKTSLSDRYTIDRVLGYGGMATVHLAEEKKHRRMVAIKVLKRELGATGHASTLPGRGAAIMHPAPPIG